MVFDIPRFFSISNMAAVCRLGILKCGIFWLMGSRGLRSWDASSCKIS